MARKSMDVKSQWNMSPKNHVKEVNVVEGIVEDAVMIAVAGGTDLMIVEEEAVAMAVIAMMIEIVVAVGVIAMTIAATMEVAEIVLDLMKGGIGTVVAEVLLMIERIEPEALCPDVVVA